MATRLTLFAWRFEILLILLLFLLGVAPALGNGFVLGLATSLVFISSVTSFTEGKRIRILIWGLFGLVTILLWLSEITKRLDLVILSGIVECAFYLSMTVGILSFTFKSVKVDRNVLASSICAYLILGMAWASLYTVIENLAPGSFTSGALALDGQDGLASYRLQQSHFSYFSLVTLSTLGYGDITPVRSITRNLAALEAIIGQLFIGILVARLVSQSLSSNPSEKS